jgi:hypothetical protein
VAAVEVPWAINELRVRSGWAGNDRYALIIFIDGKAGVFLATVGVSFALFLDNHLIGNRDGFLPGFRYPGGIPDVQIPGHMGKLPGGTVGCNAWHYHRVPGLKVNEPKDQ